jgi:hypothetical protein
VTTEAGETVGRITLDGTRGFVVFGGLAAGAVSLEPAWLAVLSFVCVGLFQGLVVTAIGARMSSGAAPVAARQRTYMLGRIAVAALALVALPGFVGSVADIL